MTTKSIWANSDGLYVRFGTMPSEDRKSGQADAGGNEHVAILDFDWQTLSAGIGEVDADAQRVGIPIGAVVRSVELEVLTAFSDTTNWTGVNIGTEDDSGSDIDADGFFASGGTGAKANLTATGTVVGETTEVDTVLSNTEVAYFLVASVGSATPTAGKARVKVKYSY